MTSNMNRNDTNPYDTTPYDTTPYHPKAPYGYQKSYTLPRQESAAFPVGDTVVGGAPAGPFGKPLRAVHIGPCFSNGGAEQQIIDLVKFLDPQRIRLEKLIVTDPGLLNPALTPRIAAEVEVGDADAVRRASKEFDIVLFWGLALDDWLADTPPRLGVFIAHGDGEWTQQFLDRSRQVTDHVIAVSHGVKHKVCQGVPTTVILNGVDAARLAQTRSRNDVRASFGFSDDDFLLGYLGRFSGEKRAHLLIQTLHHLPPSYKGLLVGWGPLRSELMELANDLIPGRFAFASGNNYLGDFYQAMDAFCLLSAHEGFALVMLEAMMCGRPVAATPVGAVPEVIRNGRNGLIVSDHPPQIAQAVAELREFPHWAQGIAASGRAYAEQHGHARRMARQYEDVLTRLWQEKQETAP